MNSEYAESTMVYGMRRVVRVSSYLLLVLISWSQGPSSWKYSVQNFTGYIYKSIISPSAISEGLGMTIFLCGSRESARIRLPSRSYLSDSPFPANGSSFKLRERFMYERRRCDSYRRSLFLAEYEGKIVLVKFCERYTYGEDAHRTLADAGLAPKLHYCLEVVGASSDTTIYLPGTVLDDIKRALEKLYDAQLVYGDMPRPNIMVVKEPKSRADDGEGEDEDETNGVGS
ncbi:hypothetical protein F5888DRAFT_1868918 [Russula emetica]|nr:hypothetical protein F5888DRAFT_1868918 [Russula emetica]